jgi:phosphonate transport system permease protein
MTAGYSAPRQLVWRASAITMLALALLWAGAKCEVRIDNLDDAGARVLEILKGFFPPDWSALPEILPEAGKTVLLGAASTLIGFILSAPLGLAAARNIAPSWIRLPVRLLLGLERATPEILILLFFVVAFGLGTFAGILTLGLASVAMLGKLLGDAIEEADPAIAESVQATGAHRWQVIRYGIVPEVIPALVSNTMFRFDYNMRMTVILGAVGAGGLGQEIMQSISRLHYQRATLAALISLIIIVSAEQFTSHVRQSWIGDLRK